MPRITRASMRAKEDIQQAHVPAVSREGSWQITQEQQIEPEAFQETGSEEEEESELEQESEEDPFNDDQGQGNGFSTMSAQELLEPLQQTADRVSRQVEEFAKCLDKFNTSRQPTDQPLWDDAERLLAKYKDIAITRRKQTTTSLQSSRSSSRNRRSLGDGENEVQQVQLEADLWSLMGSLLRCKGPQARAEAADTQKIALEKLHRYSTDLEIFEAFLRSDAFAQECQAILGWLQDTAAASKLSIDDVIQPLTENAQRGDGIWSAGWLFTKMAIKTQKRVRTWQKPLDPSNPAIQKSHLRKPDSQPLVAQMDPDARTRENNELETPDEYHEQAAWQACWETLRRGMSMEVSRGWWTERKEVWRAVATRGCGPLANDHKPSPWLRIVNLASNLEWFERCKSLAREGVVSDIYEAAVYGTLAGNAAASLKVCETIDDGLFAHFNSVLILRYQEFVRAYRQKLEKHDTSVYRTPPANYEPIQSYLTYSETADMTRAESRAPHKAIEAAIVSNSFDAFFVRQGQALAQTHDPDGTFMNLLSVNQDAPINEAAQATADNPDSLRMIVHLQLLLKTLGFLEDFSSQSLDAVENNLAAYIGWLQHEGKFALTPLYASKLSPSRAARTLGAIAIDLTDAAERNLQVELMKQYGINVTEVLDAQFQFANAEVLSLFMTEGQKLKPVSIIEYVGSGKAKSIKVKSHFMGDELDESDERAVQSVEWYQYASKQEWGRACFNASALYKMFIFQGRLVAAKALAVNAPLSGISKLALGIDLGGSESSLPKTPDEDFEMDGIPIEDRTHPISPSRKRKESKKPEVHLLTTPGVTREVLAAKAQTWRELEQLMVAMDVLEVWSDCAEHVDNAREASKSKVSELKKVLTTSLTEVRENMYPLLEPDFLSHPMDDSEAGFLEQIRTWYLPEIMLAYNSVLYFAGHAISRSWLVECMNLAQVVATNATLTNAFVQAGRMQELVTAFALSSQALLHANEAGGKKGKKDRGIDIWQVRYDDATQAVLE